MAYASRAGRARISARNPQAFAVCDRCSFWYNRTDLRNQVEWRGAALMATYIYVCNDCYDVPQEQLRSISVPADPMPIVQARPEVFATNETDDMSLTPATIDPTTGLPIPSNVQMVTLSGRNMTKLPLGRPDKMAQDAVMPWNGNAEFAVVLPILSIMSNGTPVVFVTCSAVHGLSDNDQISADGLSDPKACGFFSVSVISATAFSYETYSPIAKDSLLTSQSRVITAKAGIARNYPQVSQVGP